MRPCNRCNCVIGSGMVKWGICDVVKRFGVGVAVRICCIESRVCEVRARLMIIFGRCRVISVVIGKTAKLGFPLSRGGVVCCTDRGELREGCSCVCRVAVSVVCISFHR